MSAEPALRDNPSDDDPFVDEDMARYEAAKGGRAVSHAAVRAWLLSKNTDNPLPRPQPGD